MAEFPYNIECFLNMKIKISIVKVPGLPYNEHQ